MKKTDRRNDGEVGVGGGNGGPCGACKFLRRKCMTDCVFAPYFDSEHGTAYFASVHKVFGASNASKLLLRLPPHHRLDAAVTLCYEAIARIRDPVYGCVSHICTLQQQVMTLQSELANVRARLCIIRNLSLPPSQLASTSDLIPVVKNDILNPDSQMLLDPLAGDASDLPDLIYSQQLEEAQVQAITREFVSRCLPGVKFGPPDGSPKGFRQ